MRSKWLLSISWHGILICQFSKGAGAVQLHRRAPRTRPQSTTTVQHHNITGTMIVMMASVTLSRASFLYSIAAPMLMNNADVTPPTNNMPQGSMPSLFIDKKTSENSELRAASQLVREATSVYLRNHPSMAGSFLRLAFHDGATREQLEEDTSFLGGPNGSIRYELEWSENRGLSKPLQVVTTIYNGLEGYTTLSFSDCTALVGRGSKVCRWT